MRANEPEWMTKRDAKLIAGPIGEARFVWIGSRPQYKLTPLPADGKYTCAVMQTNNGKRLDNGEVYPTSEEALRGGLESLKKSLGWEDNAPACWHQRIFIRGVEGQLLSGEAAG